MKVQKYAHIDHSMGVNNAPSWMLRKQNEIEDGRNLRFNINIGEATRRDGYQKEGEKFSTADKPPLGAHTAQFTSGARKFVACNNNSDTQTIVRVQDLSGGTWTTIISDLPPDSDVFFCDYRDEVYISGFQKSTNIPFAPRNVNSSMDVSLTRNLLFGPYPKYFVVYRGVLYAANVVIGGVLYPDRLYKASAPTGAFAFVRGAQTNLYDPLTYVDNVPPMTNYTAPFGEASASSEVNTDNRAWQAFDDNNVLAVASRWIAAGPTNAWLKYDFGSGNAKIITAYSIVGESPTETTNRGPKTWTMEGSNDNSSWTTLHSVTNDPAWNKASGEKRQYSMTNTTAYRWYRLNVASNQGADYISVQELELLTYTEATTLLGLKVNSARYAKPGMMIDIYKSGKAIKLYTITVSEVDKQNNIVKFLPQNYLISSTDTTTDVITVPDATLLTTGTPVIFNSSNTLPAPLTNGTTYYAINTSSTTIKLATTYANALIGASIDLTTTGTGSHYVRLSYVFGNNDELYLSGTYSKLTVFWNTDYPTPDKADFSAVMPGVDSSNAITAVADGTNRLFVWTLNSTNRFDGKTTVVSSRKIGCASMRSVKSMDDDWLIWVTARGRVIARNEGAGQQQYISRGIYNKLMKLIPLSQLLTSAANVTDSQYVLSVGTFKDEPTRVIYDFDTNTWSIDSLHHADRMYINDSSSGTYKPYFFSTNGYMYKDETGNDDDGEAIKFQIVYGKNNYGSENQKESIGCYIYSTNAKGAKVKLTVDGNEPVMAGEIQEDAGQINFDTRGNNHPKDGTVINVEIVSAIKGPAQSVQAYIDYFNFTDTLTGNG